MVVLKKILEQANAASLILVVMEDSLSGLRLLSPMGYSLAAVAELQRMHQDLPVPMEVKEEE